MDDDSPAEAAPPRVGLLYDSVSENTGDIAIGIANAQELARHGIHDVVVLDNFTPELDQVDTVIVGGGELIRPSGDPFYDVFRAPEGSILNAVGVWQTARELDFLGGYAFVSARSSAEVAVLREQVPGAEVVPCTTTTLQSEHYALEGVEPGEQLVGIHVVPHTLTLCPELVAVIDAIPAKKVFLPFTHYNDDDGFMRALPFDRGNVIQLPRLTPLELHSVIGQMSYVVTSSLHASLFAYSQNVPFVTAHQEKVFNYFSDRGLERFVFSSGDQLVAALREVQTGRVQLSETVERDKALVRRTYARYAEIIRSRGVTRREPGDVRRPMRTPLEEAEVSGDVSALRAGQRAHVIANRDVVVHHLARRLASAEQGSARWHAEADRIAGERDRLQAANEVLSAYRDEVERRRARSVLGRVARVLAAHRQNR